MVNCSAVNCSNSTEKGFRLFKFPENIERRKIWVNNCRRGGSWKATKNSRLCEIHFEQCQWELHRKDGWVKLKPNAIPTIFNVPNPPARVIQQPRKSVYKRSNATNNAIQPSNIVPNSTFLDTVEESTIESIAAMEFENVSSLSLQEQIKNLREENNHLKKMNERYLSTLKTVQETLQESNKNFTTKLAEQREKLDVWERNMKSFLNEDQIEYFSKEKMKKWSDESIIKGLQFRFILGVNGYCYLTHTNYPLPSCSTLNRRIQNYDVCAGILHSILEPLKYKVHCMEHRDRYCALSVDEMQINSTEDFVKHKGEFQGFVTLGDEKQKKKLGTHLLVALIRGVKSPWKQIIGCHVTSGSISPTLLKHFIYECIEYVEKCGLYVLTLTSDMGGSNSALWTHLTVDAKKDGTRNNTFFAQNHHVYIIPDVCHLLKNLKSALLRKIISLPEYLIISKNLPTTIVDGRYIKQLWIHEIESDKSIRTLHHLKSEDINPSNFEKMHVGSAVRFFSCKTAAGIELAVENNLLPQNALTTAWFIRCIHAWFEMATTRSCKKSITKKNKQNKIEFLSQFIAIIQGTHFDATSDAWKPLNKGLILASLSLCDISELLIQEGGYDFILTSRFSQDALENIFSQVRRRGGATPTVSQCFQALKIISLSQFMSDIRKTNYDSDADRFLLSNLHFSKKVDVNKNISYGDSSIQLNLEYSYPNFNEMFHTWKIKDGTPNDLTEYDMNLILYLAGSATNAAMKRKLCDTCSASLITNTVDEITSKYNTYLKNLDKGGLKIPCVAVFEIFVSCHLLYRKYRSYILHNNANKVINKLVNDIRVNFSFACINFDLCSLKKLIITHYFCINSYSIVDLNIASKRKIKMYGTSAPKRKKITQ